MIRLASPEEMATMDERAVARHGLSAYLLMENAATAVMHLVMEQLSSVGSECSKVGDRVTKTAVFCCGIGNNGGDGYAAARLVVNAGGRAVVVALGTPKTAEAKANAKAWQALGVTLRWPEEHIRVVSTIQEAAVLVDALFGTGLKKPLAGDAKELVCCFNQATAFKLAVDIPSGVDGWNGMVQGDACRCDLTCCFQVPQPGLYQHPGVELAGRTKIVSIAVPAWWSPKDAPLWLLTPQVAATWMPKSKPQAHKWERGKVLCLTGSQGMAGATWLAGQAALRVGAGLVTLGVPPALLDKFVSQAPELMTSSVPRTTNIEHFEAPDAEHFLSLNDPSTRKNAGKQDSNRHALVMGCGLGLASETAEFVRCMLHSPLPLVLDADALNALDFTTKADLLLLKNRLAVTIITPHAGEFCRLFGISKDSLAKERIDRARWAARLTQAVVVLKGAATVVAAPDGTALINTSGDEGLATAGSGDVLSGMLGGLLAQGLPAMRAAALGVSWHGLSRDIQRIPSCSFTASMLLDGIVSAAEWLTNHPPLITKAKPDP